MIRKRISQVKRSVMQRVERALRWWDVRKNEQPSVTNEEVSFVCEGSSNAMTSGDEGDGVSESTACVSVVHVVSSGVMHKADDPTASFETYTV